MRTGAPGSTRGAGWTSVSRSSLRRSGSPCPYPAPGRRLAGPLQAALREAEESGTGVIARLPFEPSRDDRDPPFYALPQPALPSKDLLMPSQAFVPPDTAS